MNNFDHDQPLDSGLGHQNALAALHASEPITNYWREIARWCSIVGGFYIFIALCIGVALLGKDDFVIGPGVYANLVFPMTLISYALFGTYYLLAGSRIIKGIERVEEAPLEMGFRHLFLLYLINGIITVLGFLPLIWMVISLAKNLSNYAAF